MSNLLARRKGRKGLNLSPLVIKNASPRDKKKKQILNLLKHMDIYFVKKLFKEFNRKYNFGNVRITYKVIGTAKSTDGNPRLIVHVSRIEIPGILPQLLDQFFYKSSGMSRSGGLSGVFLPFLYSNKLYNNRYVKNEDTYLYNIKDVLEEEENLLNYGRFINEFIALASWKLSMLNLESDIEISDSDLHEDKIHRLKSYILKDYNVRGKKKSKKRKPKSKKRKPKSK